MHESELWVVRNFSPLSLAFSHPLQTRTIKEDHLPLLLSRNSDAAPSTATAAITQTSAVRASATLVTASLISADRVLTASVGLALLGIRLVLGRSLGTVARCPGTVGAPTITVLLGTVILALASLRIV